MSGVDLALSDGVRVVETETEQIVWSITSRDATYSTEAKVLNMKHVEAIFYMDKKPAYKVVGEDGQYNEKTRLLDLKGNIAVTSLDDGYVLRTDALEYSFRTKIAATESPIEIEGEGAWLSGVGMEASVEEKTVKIKKDVKVKMLPNVLRQKQEKPE